MWNTICDYLALFHIYPYLAYPVTFSQILVCNVGWISRLVSRVDIICCQYSYYTRIWIWIWMWIHITQMCKMQLSITDNMLKELFIYLLLNIFYSSSFHLLCFSPSDIKINRLKITHRVFFFLFWWWAAWHNANIRLLCDWAPSNIHNNE